MCKEALNQKVKEFGGAGYGMGIYSDIELLSICTGIEPERFTKNLADIFNDPRSIEGIGEKKAMVILAIKELAMRLTKKPDTSIKIVHGPEDVYHFAAPHFRNEYKEHFAIMMLNTKNHIIGLRDISIGSLTASVVHPREVFETAILHHSAAIILLHQHPSSDPSPSREDIAVTQRLVKVGKIMDIPVLDHIILGNNRFTSLKEKGLLE
ncbi:MAG TPA: DNA repair protein RadC [Selenomonas sp.]|nr:DNA repair protein RadC [Selenomonas sp.]